MIYWHICNITLLFPIFFLQKEVKNDHRRQAETKIQAAVGFRHVIDLLSSEKKLIVGHNCFLGTNISPSFIKKLF